MILKPKFWDQSKISKYSIFLFPFSFLVSVKNFISDLVPKKKFRVNSICVGNIYLGGTGKTPLIIKLYDLLKKENLKVVTAKKYYKNQIDEQKLLKKKTKLIEGVNRKKIFLKAIKNKIDLVLFDDGLQDLTVDYNLKFVCFKSKPFLGNGLIIPSGPLRENISRLKKYDAIFLNGNENYYNCFKKVRKIDKKIPIFKTNYKIKNLKLFHKTKRYYLFSGIGDPESLKRLVVKNNLNIIKEKIFSDHYSYTSFEIRKIIKDSKKINARPITTEKDYVKIPKKYRNKIDSIKIDVEIKDEKRLINYIKSKLNAQN